MRIVPPARQETSGLPQRPGTQAEGGSKAQGVSRNVWGGITGWTLGEDRERDACLTKPGVGADAAGRSPERERGVQLL